jgi:hypothetical protein
MSKNTIKKKIEISNHAAIRLCERVGSPIALGYPTWKDLVQAARYKGQVLNGISTEELKWFHRNMGHMRNCHKIRFFKGFVFLFGGTGNNPGTTLITVIKVEKEVE